MEKKTGAEVIFGRTLLGAARFFQLIWILCAVTTQGNTIGCLMWIVGIEVLINVAKEIDRMLD